jgi:CRP-like cAMP-binding protein
MPHTALIRKLETITVLAEDDRAAVLALPATVKEFAADRDIVCEGDRPSQCCLLLEGFLCRYKVLPDGNRQIMSFHIPGDIPDLQSLHIDVMDHNLATIEASKVAFIPHEAVRKLTHSHPRIADAFWRDTLIDGAIFREWIVNVGSREAYSRIAHLLCEIFIKLRAVGLVTGNGFKLPLTQAEIADATGLSSVHVNRSLMKLRADGLITLERYACTIPDFARLEEAATFDPTYLHLKSTDPGVAIPSTARARN